MLKEHETGNIVSAICRTLPNVLETRKRTTRFVGGLSSSRERKMAQKYLDHWWGECRWLLEDVRDIDSVLDTMVEEPIYRSYGSKVLGPHIDFVSRGQARAMYIGMLDSGLLPGMPYENDQWAFGDWGLTHQAEHVGVFSGAQLSGFNPGLKQEQLYLVRIPLMMVIPYDAERDLMRGEIAFVGDPLSVELAEAGDKDILSGRHFSKD